MPSDLELLGRLFVAGVLGAGVGAERMLHGQPVGLCVHALLAIGACMFTLVSAYGFGIEAEPSRVASQVVVGIGVFGGAAIARHGLSVRGIATAASIWVTASIGVAVGVGSYLVAFGGTVMILGIPWGLRAVDRLPWRRSEPH